jgi:transposase InsO family protein
LQERLSRANFVKHQNHELPEIYEKCLAAENFTYSAKIGNTEVVYKLVEGLLLIKLNSMDKIYTPPSMVGMLLAHMHLLGHKGLTRMLADLNFYYFPNMYTTTRKFVESCYGCFLSTTGTRKIKLGTYPVPKRPFAEIMMDLAENLNNVKGYQHLLVIQDLFSDFIILAPLKSKTNAAIEEILSTAIFQQHNVEKIHSDNGPVFRKSDWLQEMAASNIEIINTSSLNPAARGKIENLVKLVKLMLKRMLAVRPDYNWKNLPTLCAHIFNNTTSPRTGFKPMTLVYGEESAGRSPLDLEITAPAHYSVKNKQTHILELTEARQKCIEIARKTLEEYKQLAQDKANKNKININFSVGDYVFVLDRIIVPGASRPLKTKLQASPFVITILYHTTGLITRLTDGFTTLYSLNDLKKYEGGNKLFKDLPQEVKNVLINKFADLLQEDFCTLTKWDTFEIPDGIALASDLESMPSDQLDEEKQEKDNEQNQDKLDITEIENGLELENKLKETLELDEVDKDDNSDDSDNEEKGYNLRSKGRVHFQ